jgi:hydroxymethylglutaryl-CoA reductase (NADPH)
MNMREYKSSNDRRKALEAVYSLSLANIGSYSLDEQTASSKNCENMIGVVQVPLGVAGPLTIRHRGVNASEDQKYYVPLATTEGALVASVNRGCRAIAESGGARVISNRIGATRGPVFRVENLDQNRKLDTFLETRFGELQQIARDTSGHLKLKKYTSGWHGRYHYIRFVFDTSDAMGMNMVTIATDAMVGYIVKNTGARCVSVAGNYDIDKKPSWLNVIEGRGIQVRAEVTIPADVLKHVLKINARQVYDVWLAKCMIGSATAGSMGFNAQYANIIAAIYLATGQDLGHIGECSAGITTTEIENPEPGIKNAEPRTMNHEFITNYDLYISVYLPDIMVGTVGGGTGLATQKEALSLLGVAGGNQGKNSQKLAEITGAAVLAGEISLLASLAEGSLAKAHQRFARGNPKLSAY